MRLVLAADEQSFPRFHSAVSLELVLFVGKLLATGNASRVSACVCVMAKPRKARIGINDAVKLAFWSWSPTVVGRVGISA